MINPKYRNILFDDKILKGVPILNRYRDEIDLFFSKRVKNYVNKKINVYEKIFYIENSLPETFNLSNRLDTFNKLILEDVKMNSTFFLSDYAIDELLKKHPPNELNHLVIGNNLEKKISNRTKLALTRLTEDKSWQQKYHELLSKTTNKHYTKIKPTCIEVDISIFKNLIVKNGHCIKPWGMSHNKETGVILVFKKINHSEKTPKLLSLAVFLHYLYEVYFFSLFLNRHSTKKKGKLAEKIIRKKDLQLSFLTDGNAHDETLYWRKAICHLEKILPSGNWEFFKKNTEKLIFENDGFSSAHFVDLLWDINSIYPNTKNLYHLQQEIWLLLEENLSKMGTDKFETFVENSLIMDNMTFLKQSLKH
jgi:hypothetical protein